MAAKQSRYIEHNGIKLNIANLVGFGRITDWFSAATFSAKNSRRIYEAAVKYYLDTGIVPDENIMRSDFFKTNYTKINFNINDKNFIDHHYDEAMDKTIKYLKSDEGFAQFKKDNPGLRFDEDRNIIRNEETGEPEFNAINESEFNPYAKWLEQQQQRNTEAELGLLQAQTKAGLQSAEISAQQSMMQQAQFKDQIVEQIKLDRMAKMRKGISPMQIAQENLQFMVGNMQSANQQIGAVNQARLGAIQQESMNPYQAYLNSLYGAGYQANTNLAAGLAASDASDIMSRARAYANSQGRQAILPSDINIVMHGTEDPNKKGL